jgi:hypothetical protein
MTYIWIILSPFSIESFKDFIIEEALVYLFDFFICFANDSNEEFNQYQVDNQEVAIKV